MRLEVLDSFSALEQFCTEWSSFAETIEGLTPFQTPEWLLTWWLYFGSGQLHVLTVRSGEAIAAVIPLFRHEWNGRRQLTLIGSGISDYLEPAIAPDYSAAVINLVGEHLYDNSGWDICDWQDLAAGTPLARFGRVTVDTPCSEVKLCGTFDHYWMERSKDLRRNLRRYGDRADAMGPTEFRVSSIADETLLQQLVRLHSDRWGKRNLPGMITANNSGEFLREVTRRFEKLHSLRFFSLRFRDEVAAVSVGFLYRGTLHSYLSAFDPRFEILGFGRKLLHDSLRYGFEQGYRAWNFCRGDEPYKFSFGAEPIPKCRLIVTRGDLGKG
ncbi:MAG: GNAT family N-acetyltransferase [Acidobacteriaceae bacterium]|nr:GNAT family N-acetyltransferase [Acidobacteriaceae bacterium]